MENKWRLRLNKCSLSIMSQFSSIKVVHYWRLSQFHYCRIIDDTFKLPPGNIVISYHEVPTPRHVTHCLDATKVRCVDWTLCLFRGVPVVPNRIIWAKNDAHKNDELEPEYQVWPRKNIECDEELTSPISEDSARKLVTPLVKYKLTTRVGR